MLHPVVHLPVAAVLVVVVVVDVVVTVDDDANAEQQKQKQMQQGQNQEKLQKAAKNSKITTTLNHFPPKTMITKIQEKLPSFSSLVKRAVWKGPL